MNEFIVKGDPSNPKGFSSEIIITALNEGAKKLGLYSESGDIVTYDTCGKNHGFNAKAIICCYEYSIPRFVRHNIGDTPVIGVSRDNMAYLLEGGLPKSQVSYIDLGVDSDSFKIVKKNRYLDKFVCLSLNESLCRSGLEILIDGFGMAFSGDSEALLILKDRNARPEFKQYVEEKAKFYKINIEYINNHIDTIDGILDLYSSCDVHYYLSRSTTWGMTVLQSISCGVPTASPMYSGPRQYISDKMTGIGIEFDLEPITQELLQSLEKIGMRNYFFPITQSNYDSQPYWCKPKVESVAKSLIELKNSQELRNRVSFCGRKIAEELTWERSALNLSYVLSNFK